MAQEGRELVLAPNEFAHIQDSTKGDVNTLVGPATTTLNQTEILTKFDPETKRFAPTSMEDVKQTLITAPAGWYTLLLNPASKHPHPGKNSTPDDIEIGKKVVIPGPCTFALWPGQMADVIQGHRLRSNEYLIIEIYDDEVARVKWAEATFKEAGSHDSGEKTETEKKTESIPALTAGLLSSVPSDLANGKRYVIKGTEVAFYIPPSGVKVVKAENEVYIRKAVTLEKLEYAILLDESGDKEFAYGPKVVFPQPTQDFITANSKNKFRAFELDSLKGVHVKVIEKYDDPDGTTHKEGEEIFITGDGIIYFPRKEHSIIRYGDREIAYATAIPKGEGRYVLNRKTGEVESVRGPKMLLPNPITDIITRRILTEKESMLLYPGNNEALTVNLALASQNKDASPAALADFATKSLGRMKGESFGTAELPSKSRARSLGFAEERFGGDSFDRPTNYTEPRTVILDTKYQGIPSINVWTGYAVKVVNKTGQGKVMIGPCAILLEYDETLEPMQLSTGKPKSTDNLIETAYLMVRGNKVSDIVSAVTADLVDVKVKLSYRVNFEGDDMLKWFAIDNYVKFLCDHARSVLKSVIKKCNISDLYANSTEIIRDAILGKKSEKNPERPGMPFTENSMRIYDVEVFDLLVGDSDVQMLLVSAQKTAIKTTLDLTKQRQQVAAQTEMEKLKRQSLTVTRQTEKITHKAELARQDESKGLQLSHQKLNQSLAIDNLENEKSCLEISKLLRAIRRSLDVEDWKALADRESQLVEIALSADKTRAETAKEVAQAFTPQMVEAINNLRDASLMEKLAEHFGDLSILEGQSMMATATRFLGVIPQGLATKLLSLLPENGEVAKQMKEQASDIDK